MSETTNNKNTNPKNNNIDIENAASSPNKARNRLENLDTIMQDVIQISLRVVDSASEADAQLRVQELRQQHPQATKEQMASLLIQKKCMQAGAIGAVTSGASIIPGLGSIAALTVGAVADLSLSMKLQAELVLEIAALHEYEFAPQEKRQAILVAAGIGAGAERLMARYGAELGEEVAERFAERALVKVVPLVGVVASAGLNLLITYMVGQRAQAYFQLGPEAVGDWGTNLRAITGIDERAIGQWLSTSAAESWQSIRNGAAMVSTKLGAATQAGVANIRTLRQRNQRPGQAEAPEAVEIPIINFDAFNADADINALSKTNTNTQNGTESNVE